MVKAKAEKTMSKEEIALRGQFAALEGLIVHLLCVTTMHVALGRNDLNVVRVARGMEDLANAITAEMLEGEDPAVVALVKSAQTRIFERVKKEVKEEVIMLKSTAGM